MAAPNLLNITSIYGKTVGASVTNTATAVLSNSAASGLLYKINCITVSNVDGSNSADISISHYRGSTDRYLVRSVAVPAKTALVAVGKEQQVYLEEGDSIRVQASANNDLEVVISYEEIA